MNFSGLCAALVGSLPPPAGGNQTSQRLFPSGFLLNLCGRLGMPGRVVPNVVDLAHFTPAEGRAPRAHLVVARNLEPIYGIETALRALAVVVAQRPDALLSVAG